MLITVLSHFGYSYPDVFKQGVWAEMQAVQDPELRELAIGVGKESVLGGHSSHAHVGSRSSSTSVSSQVRVPIKIQRNYIHI